MNKSSVRKCEIVQQIKHLPGYPDNWQKNLEQNLDNTPNIKHWAYILHDKDIGEDGSPVEPHVHIVIILVESVKYSTVGGYVGVPQQYVCSIRQKYKAGHRWYADVGGALSYLTHRNKSDAHQYDDSAVVAQCGYDWIREREKSEATQKEQKAYRDILDGIESGEIRRYNLCKYASQAMYIEHKQDFEKAFEHREQLEMANCNRQLDVIYIYGESTAGKTTLAKMYCDAQNLSYAVSASDRDPLQTYAGEDAIILDDLRPETFTLSNLLKLLDNHTSSAASARYHDRWLAAKVIIITTVLSIEAFYHRLSQGMRDEPLRQLMRRCKFMIYVRRDEIQIYNYRESTGEYMLIGHGENPVAKKYPVETRETSAERLQEVCAGFGIAYAPEALPSDYVVTEDAPF